MAATTKYLLYEQVSALLKGGTASAPTSATMGMIKKVVEQLCNQYLKVDHFTVHMPSGETIPDTAVLATYERIPVERYKQQYSRAKLPAIPMSLPRNMGVFFVGPHVANENLDATTITALVLSGTSIRLTWTAVDNATGYRLERATSEDFTDAVPIYSGTALTFTDTNLTATTTYWYRVCAIANGYNDGLFAVTPATTITQSEIFDNTFDYTFN